MAMEFVVDRLDARPTSRGHFAAKCPVSSHNDRSPSVSITSGRDGRVLLHCFAGCRTSDILAAAGLCYADLFNEGPPPSPEQMKAANAKREQLEALRKERRIHVRVDSKFMRLLERRLFKVVDELGRGLAMLPDDDPGATTLTARFHAAIKAYQLTDCCIVGDMWS
jgi:hypothetical protein